MQSWRFTTTKGPSPNLTITYFIYIDLFFLFAGRVNLYRLIYIFVDSTSLFLLSWTLSWQVFDLFLHFISFIVLFIFFSR